MDALYCEASDLLNLSESKQYTLFATPLLEKLLSDSRLIKGAASLWQLLYSFAKCNNSLEVTIKYQTIAKKLGKSTKTISRYIKSLCEHGYLLNRKNFREDGGQSCYTFVLRIAKDILKDLQKAPDRKKHATNNKDTANFHQNQSKLTNTPTKDIIQTQDKFHVDTTETSHTSCAITNQETTQENKAISSNDSELTAFTFELDKTVQGGVDITVTPYINNQEVLLNNNTTVVVDKNQNKPDNPSHETISIPEKNNELENSMNELESEINELVTQENQLIVQTITATLDKKSKLYQQQRTLTTRINTLKQRKEALLANHKKQKRLATQQQSFIQTLYTKDKERPIHENQISYLRKTLTTLNVPRETQEQLTNEIIFAVRFDGLTRAKDSQKPLSVGHALNIALKLVRENRWETPARFLKEGSVLTGLQI